MPTEESPSDLPECLSEVQKQRYAAIAALARTTADRLPHPADKFSGPSHVFNRHHHAPPS
jgi:hypothetical protein